MMNVKRSRILLSITMVFFWASEYCHAPYFTPYLQTLGFDPAIIGVITGVYGFTQLCVRIPLGMATDATGRYKATILMGTLFTTVSSFWLIFAQDFVSIVICRFLAGMAASTWLAFTVLYNAYYAAEESVNAMTNVNVFNSAGKLLAFVLGLTAATLWSYREPLICSFLTGAAAVVCASLLKPIPMKREPFRLKEAARIAVSPAVLCASVFGMVLMFIMHGTIFSFTSALAQSLGASAVVIGLTTVVFTVVQVACSGLVRRLLKRLSTPIAVCISCLLLAFSCLCGAASTAAGVWLIFVGQILAGFGGLALSAVLMAMIVRNTPQEKHSTAMGVYQSLYSFGMSLGPVLMGSLVGSFGFSPAYIVAALVPLLAAAAAPAAVRFSDHPVRQL